MIKVTNEKKISKGYTIGIIKIEKSYFIQTTINGIDRVVKNGDPSDFTNVKGWKTEDDILKSEIWKTLTKKK